MSYILDALNKSEQEKHAGKTPDLATMHRRSAAHEQPFPWLLVVLAVVALNIAAFGWFLWNQSLPSPTNPPVTETRPPASPPETTDAVPSSPTQSNSTPPEARLPESVEPELITPPQSTRPDPVGIGALPPSVQRQIPDMTFSSHIYSDDADLRMVNINGTFMSEGDMIADGVRVDRITEDGVVVSFKHYLIEMSVLRDWSFN